MFYVWLLSFSIVHDTQCCWGPTEFHCVTLPQLTYPLYFGGWTSGLTPASMTSSAVVNIFELIFKWTWDVLLLAVCIGVDRWVVECIHWILHLVRVAKSSKITTPIYMTHWQGPTIWGAPYLNITWYCSSFSLSHSILEGMQKRCVVAFICHLWITAEVNTSP